MTGGPCSVVILLVPGEARQKKTIEQLRAGIVMKQALLIMGLVVCLFITPAWSSAKDQSALASSLAYLFDLPQVAWVEYDQNRVYLGFTTVGPDVLQIVRTAAINGSKAYGAQVQVWGVRVEYGGWRPGDLPYICTAIGDRGEVTSSNCPGLP
jgi:hypothetical protein